MTTPKYLKNTVIVMGDYQLFLIIGHVQIGAGNRAKQLYIQS